VARIFKKHIIGFRTFFAPVESVALNQLFGDMAEWKAAQIAKGKFIPVDKFKPRLLDGLMIFGNKKAVMEVLDPRSAVAFKRIRRVRQVARPVLSIAGDQVFSLAVRRYFAVAGLGLNLLKLSPLDFFISGALAVFLLPKQDFEKDFGLKEGENIEIARTELRGGTKINLQISRPGLSAGFLLTETVDQLAFGAVPEEPQRDITFALAVVFEPTLVALRILQGFSERTVGKVGGDIATKVFT